MATAPLSWGPASGTLARCCLLLLPPSPAFYSPPQVTALAGCDLLTISPSLLDQLDNMSCEVPAKLSKELAMSTESARITLDEAGFRWLHNEDEMAVEKLSSGIRGFAVDAVKLENIIKEKLK